MDDSSIAYREATKGRVATRWPRTGMRAAAIIAALVCLVATAFTATAQEQDATTAPMAQFRIVGLTEKAVIWIDGKNIPNPNSEYLSLTVGSHTLYIWEDGYQPLSNQEFSVRSDGESFAVFLRLKSHQRISQDFSRQAIGYGIAGTVLAGGCLLAAKAVVAKSNSMSWDQLDASQSDLNAEITFCAFGITVGVAADIYAVIAGIISGVEFALQRADTVSKPGL